MFLPAASLPGSLQGQRAARSAEDDHLLREDGRGRRLGFFVGAPKCLELEIWGFGEKVCCLHGAVRL